MKNEKQHSELIVTMLLWLVGILCTLGVVSSIMWYVKAREVAILHSRINTQTQAMLKMADDLHDKSYKIEQANRMLAVAYPKAGRKFISED